MNKKEQFMQIFTRAENKYKHSSKRLAAEGWEHSWQVLIATIMSAQSRDETTIPIAQNLFAKYPKLEDLANSKYNDVFNVLKSINYNRTKSRNVIAAAKYILENFNGEIPNEIDKLVQIPGVGRKTANLVITECYAKEGICVDTHVHRIANVFGLVKTKNATQTEFALMQVAPKEYWSSINRIFVLWGKDVPGKDRKRLLARLEDR